MTKKDIMFYWFPWFFVLVFLMGFPRCRTDVNLENDPFYDSFYEKTQIIMTKEERKIYKLLPDETSKEEFIEEFWRIRDPNSGTVENENKIEFEDRINYANKWFGKWNPSRGRERTSLQRDDLGWNTDRGHIYILLGQPDELYYDGRERMLGGRMLSRPQGNNTEQWLYYIYRTVVRFEHIHSGTWHLVSPTSELMEAMKTAKMNLIDSGHRLGYDWRFKFTARYENENIILSIPRKRLAFKEIKGQLFTELWIKINIYVDNNKIDSLENIKKIAGTEEELFELKKIEVHIPYKPGQKGKYLFDIIAEDKMAVSFAKYRHFLKKKLK